MKVVNYILPTFVWAVLTATSICAQAENYFEVPQEISRINKTLKLLDFPFEYKQIDVRRSLTTEKLLRSTENPNGIFTSTDHDTSTISDFVARKELTEIAQRNQPFWARYVDEGPKTQDVVILFHGIPTYSYLYREVIGPIAKNRRVIAFDQLGQGFSGKSSNLTYTFKQQLAFVEAFFEGLNLPQDTKLTVVVHDTGGFLGTSFAARHQDKVKNFVLFETLFGPIPDSNAIPPLAQFLQSPEGQRAIVQDNIMIRDLIIRGHTIQPPSSNPLIVDELDWKAKLAYIIPYINQDSRRVLAQWLLEVPLLDGDPLNAAFTNLELFLQQAQYLTTTTTPKLYFYAEPGFNNPEPVRENLKTILNVNNSLTAINLGKGFHFLQEDQGVRIGQEINRWLRELDGLPENPSAEFPYQPRYTKVLGSQMHYIDEGKGPVVLMLHGNPTSSYLWRNVIPYISPKHRVIAVDLIGMGKSDKPKIDYTFEDHRRYLDAFIEKLNLREITLVIHDWGSALGLDYAARKPSNVRAVAFMEAILPPLFPATFETLPTFTADFFRMVRDPILGPQFIIEQNGFIEEILPSNILRPLTNAELDAYRAPYPTPETRRPLLVWPLEVPIEGEPANVVEVVKNYSDWLQRSHVPKLHVYVEPGVLNSRDMVQQLAAIFPNYESAFVGEGLHFIQEDAPEAIGLAIAHWLARL